MFCPSCGKPVPEGAAFCTECGAKISVSQAPAVAVRQAPVSGGPFAGSRFIIEQKIAAMRDTFGIKDANGSLLAYVKKKMVSFGPEFWFESPEGVRLGEVKGKVVAVRPTYEVNDAQGQLVAIVKKKVLKLLGSEWWLENASGQEIARVNGNITAHDFTIQSPAGTQLARITKKWVSLRDSYGVEILSSELNPYLVLAYCIALDSVEYSSHSGGVRIGFG